MEKEIESLQDEMANIMKEINETERQLIETGELISDATKRLEKAEKQEAEQYDDMLKRIVVFYESDIGDWLEVFVNSGSIVEVLQDIENVKAIHEYDRKALEEYIAIKDEIIMLKNFLEEEQKDLQILQVQLEHQQEELDDKISSKKAEIQGLEEQIAEATRQAIEEAAMEAHQDNSQMTTNIENVSYSGLQYTGSGDRNVGQAIVDVARTYLGVDYVWGGNDYNGIDCSGLTKAAHAAVGISIDRWSGAQAVGGKAIGSLTDALPGDIICYSGHVAIYIGNYRVIHAPHTGTVVQEATVYLKEIIAIRRYW